MATILAINAYNLIPIKGLNYSKEEILFRDTLKNKLFNLDYEESLDNEILTKTQEYMKQKGKHREIFKKPSFHEGEIIYIKFDLITPTGINSSFSQHHRGPMKIIQIFEKKRFVIARELKTAKYFHIDFNRIIRIEPEQIKLLASQQWENVAFTEIRRASNKLNTNKIELHPNLTEKIKKLNLVTGNQINEGSHNMTTRSKSDIESKRN